VAEVIGPVRETYLAARRAGVAVIYLTGRKERDRAATERNLRRAGVGDYAELIVKPDTGRDGRTWANAVEFKTEMRRELAARGWTIIANIGDQKSDLLGGYAEKTFKLPNPFYITE
jgi:acid phosphatase